MNMVDYAARAAADIELECPANGCCAQGSGRVDVGRMVPGGWSSARRLVEGLYGGKAIINLSQQFFGQEQLPTVEVLCDDPVTTAHSFKPEDGVMGLRRDDGTYALAYREGAQEALGAVMTASPASLCGAVMRAASLIPDAVAYLIKNGVAEENIQWGWSCAPVIFHSLDAMSSCCAGVEGVAEHGVCSIWVRGDAQKLKALAEQYTLCRLRLHHVECAKTYGAE